jgi:menaquinone-dependent protoporphyrinogen IX oxidase
LNPTDEDPIDTATKIYEIESKDKDPWVIKAFLGALSIDKAKFNQRELLTFITKLSQCGKAQGLALLR